MEKFIKDCFITFEKIGATTSRNDKEAYLKAQENNPVIRELLYCCYNPFMMFYIKKVPALSTATKRVTTMSERYQEFLGVLNLLNTRVVTGNEAIGQVSATLSVCGEEEIKWYSKVLQKDLKIGITEATINKVFGKDFIPTYSCMLAHPIRNYPKRSVIQPKLDGYRCNAFNYGNGRIELRTRNGNLIEGYTVIEQEVEEYVPVGYMVDGEIMARQGEFNATQSDVFKKGKKDKDGVLSMFDIISIKEFEAGKGSMDYETRLDVLDGLSFEGATSIMVLESAGEYDDSEYSIQQIAEKHVEYAKRGFEGTMIKDLDSVYECKRSYAVQKLKDMDTLDLVVIDVEEGKAGTDREGTLGALVVDFEGNPVNVGSGFKKNPGHEYSVDTLWARRTDLINRTVEVKYQEITSNKNGTRSLRFPVFVRIRDDK